MVSPYPNLEAITCQQLEGDVFHIQLLHTGKQAITEWLNLCESLYQHTKNRPAWRFLLDCSHIGEPPPMQYMFAQLRHWAKNHHVPLLSIAILYEDKDAERLRLINALFRTFNDVGRQAQLFSHDQREEALAWLQQAH